MIKLGSSNIGRLYFGSNAIGKAYLGSNLVYQSGAQPQPTTIPYIRGGGDGSYIDTGITPDNTTRVVLWARNISPYTEYVYVFGSRVALTDSAFYFYAPSNYYSFIGSFALCFGNSGEIRTAEAFEYMSNYHKYELYNGELLVDDVAIAYTTSSSFSSANTIHLFGLNNNGAHVTSGKPIDICACKIYKNNVLVRDYSAVDSPSVGLYDAVSDTVFTNTGSGSFTYGTFNKNAYKPLEYIECSTGQYFNTGVYGTYDLPITCVMMPTNTTAQWTSILGERISSPANSCDFALGTATAGEDNMRLYWRFGQNTTSGQAFGGSTSNKLTNKKIIVVKKEATAYVYRDFTQIGSNQKSGVPTSFSTTYPLAIGTLRTGASSYDTSTYIGRFYHINFGATKNYVPAKVNGVAGMYDTYNDVFYPSDSETAFIAGPEL